MSEGAVKKSEGLYSLEILGYVCPYSTLLTLRALEKLSPTEVLEVVLDNVPSVDTIPSTVEDKGYKVLEVKRLDTTRWRIAIKK